VNESVQFSDNSTGNPTSWSWSFGDSSSSRSALQNPGHACATAGTFTVTLAVNSASGSDTTDRTVTFRPDSPTEELLLPGGEYEMGDHYGFVDPSHPSDELPIHRVRVSPFYMAETPTTNQQYLAFLGDALARGLVDVRNGIVYAAGTGSVYYYTHQYATYYSIGFDGTAFSMADFRANHPVGGGHVDRRSSLRQLDERGKRTAGVLRPRHGCVRLHEERLPVTHRGGVGVCRARRTVRSLLQLPVGE
jgi:PKD repeat protein